jgi:hypothetical protein
MLKPCTIDQESVGRLLALGSPKPRALFRFLQNFQHYVESDDAREFTIVTNQALGVSRTYSINIVRYPATYNVLKSKPLRNVDILLE